MIRLIYNMKVEQKINSIFAERRKQNIVETMDLYKRASDETVRDSIAAKFFELRDFDYKVKML